MWKNIKMICG